MIGTGEVLVDAMRSAPLDDCRVIGPSHLARMARMNSCCFRPIRSFFRLFTSRRTVFHVSPDDISDAAPPAVGSFQPVQDLRRSPSKASRTATPQYSERQAVLLAEGRLSTWGDLPRRSVGCAARRSSHRERSPRTCHGFAASL